MEDYKSFVVDVTNEAINEVDWTNYASELTTFLEKKTELIGLYTSGVAIFEQIRLQGVTLQDLEGVRTVLDQAKVTFVSAIDTAFVALPADQHKEANKWINFRGGDFKDYRNAVKFIKKAIKDFDKIDS